MERRLLRLLLPLAGPVLLMLAVVLGDASAQSGTPSAPAIDSVSAGDRSLAVAWSTPSDTGSSAITAYDLRYILTSEDETVDANWTVQEDVWSGAGPLLHTVTGVDNAAQYDVQVRAVNSRGDGAWSPTVTATPADHGGSRSGATEITLQTPTLGYISSAGDEDYFELSLTEETGVFIFTTSYTSGFLATTGNLQNSGGGVIETAEAGPEFREHGGQLLIWASLSAGTYYVRVEAPEAGYYTLHTQPAPDSSSVDDAVGINLDGRSNGILAPGPQDEDFFRFELSAAADVMIWLPRALKGLDPLGTLLDADGEVVASHDDSFLDGGRSRHFIIREELSAGVYFLKVSGAPAATFDICRGYTPSFNTFPWENCNDTEEKSGATEGGPYTVAVESVPARGSSIGSATALLLGESALVGGRINTNGDSDYFSITVDEPTHVKVEVVSADIETEGAFYGTNRREEVVFISDTDYLPGALGFSLHANLETGTSYVRVKSDAGAVSGPFAVRASVDDDYTNFLSTCSGLSTAYADPLYGCQWSMNNTGQDTGDGAGTSGEDINVEEVWDGGNLGEGVNVALVASGLYHEHEDLRDNVDTSRNHDYTGRGDVFERHFTHGTAMAGLIAARDNSVGMRGVAPRATIYAYNFIRNITLASLTDSQTRNRDVTAVYNNSWGFIDGPGLDPSPRLWELAVESGVNEGLDGKGAFYVHAAGNGAMEGDHANLGGLENFYAVTTACAVNDLGQRSGYSEQGSNLWVCAPSGDEEGERQGNVSTHNYDRYRQDIEGTAASAALVSGVAALVRKANANLTWRDVKLILAGSARKNDAGDSGWATGATKYGSTTDTYNFNHQYGFGVVDAKAAVDLATSWVNVPQLESVTEGSASDLDLAVPDGGSASASLVAGAGVDFIEYVDVHLNFAHQSFRDLKVELTSPAGATSVLSVSHDSEDKYPLNGEFRFGTAAHLGEGSSGTWSLRITDEVTGTAGKLKSWRLRVYGQKSRTETPEIASVTPDDAGLIVGWTALDDDTVTAYDLRHIESSAADKADANWMVVDNAVTSRTGSLTYAIAGLTNDTSYDVQVRAVRGSVDGAWSDTAVGTPSAGAAAVPAIEAIRSEDTAFNVSWSAPTSPPSTTTAYDVQYKPSVSSSWTVVVDAWTEGALEYTITGLTNGVGYDVQVRHVGTSDGAWSTTATGHPADFGNTVETAGTLVLDSPVHGVINGVGDVDVLKFELKTTRNLWLYTTGDTDTMAELLNSNGDAIGVNDSGDLPNIGGNFLLPAILDAGAYYLRVSGSRNFTGDYVLWAEGIAESTGRSNATPLPLDGTVRSIFDNRDEDYFKLELTAETELVLRTAGRRDTVASLTDNSGVEIASNDDGYFAGGNVNFLIRTQLAAGVYYLKLHEFYGFSGAYVVHAETATEPGGDAANAHELTLGVAGGGNIDAGGDTDFFKFTLTERSRVTVSVVSEVDGGGPLKGAVELQDSSFNAVQTYPGETGVEYVSLGGGNTLGAGTYYLELTWTTSLESEDYAVIVLQDSRFARLEDRCAGSATGISDQLAGCQWHLVNEGQLGGLAGPDLNVESVWDSYKGAGINVVVVDDGLDYEHEDLSTNVDTTKNHSYVDGETVRDMNPWHGTSVGGIIAADDNEIGVRGVAPDVTIYAHNLLAEGQFNSVNAADAMIRNMVTTAVNNNSWGPDETNLPEPSWTLWKMAVESAITEGYDGKGVFFAWAGGNGGDNDYSSLDEFANFYGVTAVCAVNYEGQRSSYSEPGANLWVCGPSDAGGLPILYGITTTALENSYTGNFGGTSAATPMVSGVAALMREANDALTWRDIKLILAASARKVDANDAGWGEGALEYGSTSERYHFNYEYGFGLADARAAVDMALGWTNAPAFRQVSVSSGSLDQRIPNPVDGDYPAPLTFTLNVGPYVGFVEYVHVRVDLEHTSFRDLHIELVSPSGVVSVLSPALAGPDGLGESWSGEFQYGSAKHLGENGAGEWKLRITDRIPGGAGTLNSWSITVYGHGDGPGFPEIDTVTPGVRSATIEWSAPTITGNAGITSYDLRYRNVELDSDWERVETIWTSGSLSYTLTGIEGDGKYDIQVRARSNARAGPWSEPVFVETNLSTPAAPSITSVRPGNRTLGVTWTLPPEAVGDEITSYDLRYILTSADETVDANWTARTRIWASGALHGAQSGLTNGSGYDVQVRAVNRLAAGAWSAKATGTPADQIDVRLQWASSATMVNENAGTVTLKAVIETTENGALPSGFSVDVDVGAAGTAGSPADYTLQTATLTFASADFTPVDVGGQTRYRAESDVVVAIVNDTLNEGNETVTLTLAYDAPNLPHLQGTNARLTVTIADDDHGPVSISWQQSSVTVDEGAGTVTLHAVATTAQDQSPGADFVLSASVSSVDGTAARSDDFTPLSRTVVFNGSTFRRTTVAGQRRYRATLDVVVPIVDDGDDEPDEELTVVLAYVNPTLPHLQGPAVTARVIIRDNDFVPVTISWDQSIVSVDEHAGTATLQAKATTTVDRMPESGFSVLLSATTADDTATQGSDYRRLNQNFSFGQSDFSRTDVNGQYLFQAARDITVSITDDREDEPDEAFTVTLAYRGTTQSHYTGGSAEARVTVIDNEQPSVRLGWEETAITVEEPTTPGGTRAVTLTALAITLGDQPPESAFTLDFTVVAADGTATQPSDYGQHSETVSIASSSFAQVTVSGQIRYQETRTYTFFIEDDTVDEEDETFTVTLAFDDPGAPYLVAGDMRATITIEDNDHVGVTLGWQQTSVTANEPTTSGGTTAVNLRARAVTATNKQPETGFVLDFSVFSTDGTAQYPADYAGVSSGGESFAPSDFSRRTVSGQSRFVATRDFTVTIADDTADEPNETFTVELSLDDPSLPHLSGGDTEVTVTINDNDHVPVELSWEESSLTVDEDMGRFTLTAEVTTTADKMPEAGFVAAVSVESVDGSATQGADYTRLSRSHSFRPAAFSRVDTGGGSYRYRATREFTVTIREDTADEESEQFGIVLAYNNPALPHLTGGSAAATVAITDNDHVPVTLGWEETQFTAEEPTSVGDTTPVTLTATAVTATDKRPESGFTFDFTVNTADGSARQTGDYERLSVTETFDRSDFSRQAVNGQFRWVAGETFTVQINHDTIIGETETFRVLLAFEGPSQPYLLRGDMTATVTVTDDASSLSDLRTTVTADSSTVSIGEQLTYSWSVTNYDVSDTTNARLTGTLDSGVALVSAEIVTPATGQCTRSSRTVTCTFGTLAQFDAANGTIVVNVSDNTSADINFTAHAEGDQLDRTPSDNDLSLTTELDAPPRRITNLRASGKSTHIDLTWSAPGDNGSPITSYELQRKSGAEDYVRLPAPDPNALSYRDEDVVENTEYTYQLRAVNSDGQAEWSNEATARASTPPPPGRVTNLAAEAQGGSQIDLTWSRPASSGSPIIRYQLQRRQGDGSFSGVTPAPPAGATSYSDTGLNSGTIYTYRLRAVNGAGAASWSNEVGATTVSPPAPPRRRSGGGGGGGGGGGTPPPPNRPPVFAEGANTVRSAPEYSRAGTAIGARVAATDADRDPLTYTVGGVDGASFAIDRSSGQLRASSALDFAAKPRHAVLVVVSDGKGGRAAIAVTIIVTEVGLGDRYDADNSGTIDKDEAIVAVVDYFNDLISKDALIEVIKLYFFS